MAVRSVRSPRPVGRSAALLVVAAIVVAACTTEPVWHNVGSACIMAEVITWSARARHTPDPVPAGGSFELDVEAAHTALGSAFPPTPVTRLELWFTVPAGMTVDAVTFEGGNLVGSAPTSTQPLKVVFTASPAVAFNDVRVPTIRIGAHVDAGTAPGPIAWKAWTYLAMTRDVPFDPLMDSCSSSGPPVLDTVTVAG
jgi:hypothetical protein